MKGAWAERLAMRWRLAGLLLAVCVSVALPYMYTRSATEEALAAHSWVAHTADVKATVYELAFYLRDMEAATYSLLQGADRATLQKRIDDAKSHVQPLLQRLRNLTRDNPDQQSRLGSLDALVNGRVALMDQARDRYLTGNTSGAYGALADALKMFAYRPLAEQVVAEEQRLLAQRAAVAERQGRNARISTALAALAQLVLLAIVVVVSERQVRHRLRAQRETRQAVARSMLIVQAVREPIAMLDADLDTLLVNAAFLEMYGEGDRPQQSRPLAEIGEGAWNDAALLQRLTDVVTRDRELWDYEIQQTTVDGVVRHMLINARRMTQPDGEAVAVLLTVSDITARKVAEDQVNELNRQLEGKVEQISDINRELEAFSYSVSHDLRAPLRHIAGFSDKLQRHLGERADEKTDHYLNVIGDAARRMAQLIDDLLVYSRLGRGALRMQPVDMQSLVAEAQGLVEDGDGEHRIAWQVAPLPVVVGDANMLRTVWQNLLGNAVKYSSHREHPRIEVSVARGQRGDYIFSVTDNGAGFDMRFVDKLFGVFQRLHKASEFPGSGIGLANVRRIVARHGGRTWAEGEPDKGARFHFSLPASARADAPDESTT